MPGKRKRETSARRHTLHQKSSRHRALREGDTSYIPAAQAKNAFAMVLDEALQGRKVIITKHDVPKAVVMSLEKFNALSAAAMPSLEALTADFDARVARAQTPQARKALANAFAASPEELGEAAVQHARARLRSK